MNDATGPLLRVASQWVLGALLAVVLSGLFLAINAVQLTSQDSGQRVLRRAVAVTTDIDAILPEIEVKLRAAARDARPDSAELPVPDFPISVLLTPQEARRLEGDQLRERILEESARRLYEDGTSAWTTGDPEGRQKIEAISTAGALDRGLGLITEETHNRILIATAVLGFLAAALAALLLMTVRSYGRLIALGAVTLVGALPSLAASIAMRFSFRTAEEEADPFVRGLLNLGVETMWVPIRNYLALSALGFAVLALTLVLIWVQGRRRRPPAAPAADAPAAP